MVTLHDTSFHCFPLTELCHWKTCPQLLPRINSHLTCQRTDFLMILARFCPDHVHTLGTVRKYIVVLLLF